MNIHKPYIDESCSHKKICTICNPVNILLRRYQMRNSELIEQSNELFRENKGLKEQVSKLQSQLADFKNIEPQEQCKFKVGDRVVYYRKSCWYSKDISKIKGTVEEINAIDNTLSILSDSKLVIVSGIPVKDCKKLVRKTPDFKIGDRVITKEGKVKGTIFDILYNIVIIMDSGSLIYTHAGNLNRLVRKKKEFKVGDRVIFNTADLPAIKGTVIEVKRDSLHIKTDNKELGMAIILTKHCKRLVRKPKFKVGDRVSFSMKNHFKPLNIKGKITQIAKDESDPMLLVRADDHGIPFYPRISECKRLVKVKKVNCGECDGKGHTFELLFSRFFCFRCSGTGKVKVKKIPCAGCRGKGYISSCFPGWRDIECKRCGGLGKITP